MLGSVYDVRKSTPIPDVRLDPYDYGNPQPDVSVSVPGYNLPSLAKSLNGF